MSYLEKLTQIYIFKFQSFLYIHTYIYILTSHDVGHQKMHKFSDISHSLNFSAQNFQSICPEILKYF